MSVLSPLLVPVMILIMALKNHPCDGSVSPSSPCPRLFLLKHFDWVIFMYIPSASVQEPLTPAQLILFFSGYSGSATAGRS